MNTPGVEALKSMECFKKLQAVKLFEDNSGFVGNKQVLKDLVSIENDGQPLKSSEQMNDAITFVSNSLVFGISVDLRAWGG